jgi:hypothetical protein
VSGASLADLANPGLARSRAGAGVGDGRLTAAWRVVAVGLAIFALAAGVRLAYLGTYVTIDESRWVQRGSDFWALIGQGNDEDTFIIGHPGVTTMWTAVIGLGPERARHFSFLEGRDDATRRDGYYDALVASRRPFALVGALGVAAVALLGWRLLGPGPGILAGLLLSLEPFLVAHARVTHLDSGLTTYSAITVLSALVLWWSGGAWPYLLLSGVAMGLAFLTKAPSVYLVGFVPLVVGLRWLTTGRRLGDVPKLVLQLVIWGLLAGAVGMALWPALRVDPVSTLLKMARFTERVGGGEHDNFFAGTVTDDPGPLFYPLALLFRLAPVTLVGAILPFVFWRRLDARQRSLVPLLGLYGVGFMAMMDIGPKKFDRYVLPIFPMLGLLAGVGISQVAGWLVRRGDPVAAPRSARSQVMATLALAVLLQAATLLPFIRYPLAYYNPLLGGGAAAERLILVGWGEGLDRVGDWLDEQPRLLGEPTVATSYHRVLQAQVQGSAVPLERVRMADYVVPYVNTLQRNADLDVLGPYLTGDTPEHAVTIDGIEYARVYKGPHYPTTLDLGAQIGGRLTLLQAVIAPGSGDLLPTEEVTVGLRWDRTAGNQERVAVQVLASDGKVVVQDDRPLGSDGPDAQGRPGEVHHLTVPPRTPPGTYRLIARVQDGRTRAAVPVTAGPGSGGEIVPLRDLTVGRAP